ncbi:unnamed protein product [Rotaria magnacalcarata]|uniref:Uncharacterized protein n=1 Tax=Rotaria magnacalcarata TaxID=392030 RepID=A0A8S2KAZ5_9BILA|nr:unnamed protein product [Rotaria magnacalcarata]
MSGFRNRHDAPRNQPYGSTQCGPSQDGATQRGMTQNSSYDYDASQHTDDMNPDREDHRKKIMTNDTGDLHLQKPYEWHYTSTSGQRDADQFIETLHLYASLDGPGTGEHKEAIYQIGGTHGTATYIYVVINRESSNNITVAFSYNYLTESLTGSTSYTSYAGEITLDWLKWKACTSLQGMLPWSIAPKINWT